MSWLVINFHSSTLSLPISSFFSNPPHTQFHHPKDLFQMPNISFDVFFDTDFINITATRAQGAPKVKPEWKTRTAPKLPPKPLPPPSKDHPRPSKITGPRITELPEDKPVPKAKAAAPKAAAAKAKGVPAPESIADTESVAPTPKPKVAAPKKDLPKPKATPKTPV